MTGAASGIGLATVRALHDVGTQVVGLDLNPRPEDLDATEIPWLRGDVTATETWQELARLVQQIDPRGADALVCCAGSVIGGNFADSSVDEWRRAIDVNLIGTVRAMQAVLPTMSANRDGAIVAVCSMNSFVVEYGAAVYSTSKAALLHAVRSAAVENAPFGIRINAVCPGCVDTPLLNEHLNATGDAARYRRAIEQRTPTGALVSADEVARTIRFLISRDASGIAGASIVVDGGLTVPYDFAFDAAIQ